MPQIKTKQQKQSMWGNHSQKKEQKLQLLTLIARHTFRSNSTHTIYPLSLIFCLLLYLCSVLKLFDAHILYLCYIMTLFQKRTAVQKIAAFCHNKHTKATKKTRTDSIYLIQVKTDEKIDQKIY